MNFSEILKDFFLKSYGDSLNKSNLFISFEPVGCMIDTYGDEIDESIARLKANEQLAILSERLPDINETLIAGSDRLSELYETLIQGARFYSNELTKEEEINYQNIFSKAKSEAIEKIENSKRASLHTAVGEYYEVSGTPNKWYDKNAPIWTNKKFVTTEPIKDNTLINSKPIFFDLKWRNIGYEKKNESNSLSTKINLQNKYLLKENINSKALIFNSIKRTPPEKQKNLINTQKVTSLSFDLKIFKKNNTQFNFASRAIALSKLLKERELKEQNTEANNIEISFDYCLVNLKRDWFDKSLIYYASFWYSIGMQKNFFSNGAKDETNDGELKCISIAMILIKNLKIKAKWHINDIANAESSIGLGMFNILDHNISSQNELINTGIQTVGWICEVLPSLPLYSDPVL